MKPFALLLGGRHPNALLELHDICFVMATDQKEAFKAVVDKWFGDPKSAHVDAWLDLSIVDGHQINLKTNPSGNKLFFINIGCYQPGVFREDHQYLFYVCRNKQEAKTRALAEWKSKATMSHVDNLMDIDSLIEVAQIGGTQLGWEKDPTSLPTPIHVGYWPLTKYR
ncbi:MAG: DUF1543 domain-containing protein [Bdellovibrionaceae bacterium]|nr:DUF1543 domain-containing protein [Pseudobdellovibrionaceae bacterium]